MANMARAFNDTILRLTGLDPAAPNFGPGVKERLSITDAFFVDIIHTRYANYSTQSSLFD